MEETASFGYLVRRRRKAHDLTQDELARRVGCAPITIQKIEADERRPSQDIAARLADVLKVPPEERESFVKAARGEVPVDRLRTTAEGVAASWHPTPPPLHNLPVPLTALIGREREIAAAMDLLHEAGARLVTLTGPGGIGKTCLAVQVATELLPRFPEGVRFVALAAISDPALVIPSIAQALGVRQSPGGPLLEQLQAALRDRQLLLVLDNFEQVLPAAVDVAALLTAAPHLKLLVTSRAPLHLPGEHEFAVPPLALPDPKAALQLAQLTHYEAVALFIARTRAVRRTFQVTDANAPTIAAICIRLGGLPLAIELAAARCKLLEPEALLARLEHQLRLLTGGPRDLPPRQQTMRATIDWSYNLLEPTEQRLFARLAVFVGGWTLEASEAICDATRDLGIDVLEGLQSLVDKSLIQLESARAPSGYDDADQTPRFRRWETIREYAREQLEASGEREAFQRSHLRYYVQFVEAVERQLGGGQQTAALDRLEQELDNVRAALQAALDYRETELALRLCIGLHFFWVARGNTEEGSQWLERALEQSEQEHGIMVSPAVRAMALTRLGWFFARSSGEQAQHTFQQALAMFQELGDERGIAWALNGLAFAADRYAGDTARARELWEESLCLFHKLGDTGGAATIQSSLAMLNLSVGDTARALPYAEEALNLYRQRGDASGMANALNFLGGVAWDEGDYPRANALFAEGLELAREVRDQTTIGWLLNSLGELALLEGSPAAPARYEESLTVFRAARHTLGTAHALFGLGYAAQQAGDPRRMAQYFRESLGLFMGLGEKAKIAWCVAGLAGVAALEAQAHSSMGRDEQAGRSALRAARLFGAAEALTAAAGGVAFRAWRLLAERNAAIARLHVEEARWAAAWCEGQTMVQEQAVTYALEGGAERTSGAAN